MRIIVLIVLSLFIAAPAISQTPSGLSFHDAWTVPYGENQPREYHIYGIMSNLTPQKDTLLRAESPLGKSVVFETLVSLASKKTLASVETLDVPAEQVMFYDPRRTRLTLKRPLKTLKVGDTFPLILTFRRAGTVKTMVEVKRCCEAEEGEYKAAPATKDSER
jgi:copper(I)-binding protein